MHNRTHERNYAMHCLSMALSMKLLSLLLLAVALYAQPTLTTRQTSIGVPFPGTQMTFEVDLANSSNVIGQFPTLLISGGPITNVALGSSATGLSKSITTTALDATYSVIGVTGNAAIHVPDGPVLTFTYTVPLLASGTTSFGLWNVTTVTDTSSNPVTATGIPYSATIVNRPVNPSSTSGTSIKGK